MLDVSKLNGGHLSLELAEIDVAALVREVVPGSRPTPAAACPLTLRLDQPVKGARDATRLNQIVTNLIGNAYKYGAGAPVEISVEGDETEIRLTVRDHALASRPPISNVSFAASNRRRRTAILAPPGARITSELVKALGGQITLTARRARAPRSP